MELVIIVGLILYWNWQEKRIAAAKLLADIRYEEFTRRRLAKEAAAGYVPVQGRKRRGGNDVG